MHDLQCILDAHTGWTHHAVLEGGGVIPWRDPPTAVMIVEDDDAVLREPVITEQIHLAGPAITFLTYVRQRCMWCGYVLIDEDLARVSVDIGDDGSVIVFPVWPVEAFIRVRQGEDGSAVYEVVEKELSELADENGEPNGNIIKVPEDGCMSLPPEMTL